LAGQYNLGTAEGLIRIKYDGTQATKKAQDDVEAVGKKSVTAGVGMERAGRTAGIAGAAIAAGLGLAAKTAVDFEHQISAIGAVSGATGPQLDAFRKKALQLGADTVFSASQAAQAMEELAKAGVSVPDILNGAADATVALAAAGGVALPEAATLAANAMNSFNLRAQDMTKIADLIAGAANASAIDVSQFGQSLQQAGAVAHLAGLSFADTATAIALMGNAGIKGSDAGTSLKTFLQNLIPQTKIQIELFKKLGLVTKDGANQFFDARGKVKSLADVSQVLQNALRGQNKEQQLATLQTIFGSDAIRAAAVLANNGAAGFNNMAKAMGNVSASDVAAARLNNTAGQIEQLKGSAETAAIAFGELLLPAITKLARLLTQFANFLAQLSGSWKTTIVVVLGVVAAILLVAATVIKVIQVVKAFQVLWAALNVEILGTPLGWIILAIAALIAIIIIVIKYHRQIGAALTAAWNAVWNVLKAIGAWFAGPFVNFFKGVWNWLKSFGLGVAAIFVGLWRGIVSAFDAVRGPILSVVNAVVGYFRFLWSGVQAVLNFFLPLFTAVFGAIVAVVRLWWSVISAIFTVAFTIWKAIFTAELALIRLIWNATWTWFATVIRTVFGPIVAFIRGQILLIRAVIESSLAFIRLIWNSTWNWFATVVHAVIGPLVAFIRGQIELIRIIVTTVINATLAVWRAEWNIAVAVVRAVIGAIVAVVRAGVSTVSSIFNGIKAVVDKVRGFFNQLRAAASGGVGSLISFVASIPGKILGAIGNLGSLLYNAGTQIIQGMVNGIKALAGRVADAVRSIISSIPSAVKKLLGIGSPSRVMMVLAKQTMEGYVKGLLDSTVPIQQAQHRAFGVPAVNTISNTSSLNASRTTNMGGITINNNMPAAVVDPEAQAAYTVRKLNARLAVRG
jgi:TP901 family phage tail tape measure protein